MLESELQAEKYRDYTAVIQASIARMLCGYFGGEWQMPEYMEFMYPWRTKVKEQTFEEIKAHVLKRLTE